MLAAHQGGDGRQVPTGAVTGDQHFARVDAEFVSVGRHRAERGVHVLHGRGCTMLGREPIVNRDDNRLGVARHRPAEAVMRIQIAEHEPATVTEHHRGRRTAVPCGR